MDKDLNIIKKKYGEKFSQLCRELFPTLLESEGLLSKLILDNFYENHYLYQDIVDNRLESVFKNYIYSLVDVEKNNEVIVTKTPEELMNEVGYILYECKCEEDIQKFRKYYAKDEELCTFNGNRLDRCYVYFAVKENVDEINRVDFASPNRQDEYGTSVISIQFTKDSSHTLSIKNRYNHMVNNLDATFSNNLDNIIPGLTDSFAEHYGMVQSNYSNNFEIPGYVRASDGRYYKFNYEINNICYCCDNIIIDNFEVKKYDKSRYLIIDYFIIDLVNKEIKTYDGWNDSFVNCVGIIDKISIINILNGKKIKIVGIDGRELEITIDALGRIIKLYSSNIELIGKEFLYYNNSLTECIFTKLERVDKCFLFFNEVLMQMDALNLKQVGDLFLPHNLALTKLNFPNLESVGNSFLSLNNKLSELMLPNLKRVGDWFLGGNNSLTELMLPNLKSVGGAFLRRNQVLVKLDAPVLTHISYCFLQCHCNKDKLLNRTKVTGKVLKK